MPRDLPRYDVRGLLKFFSSDGWTACPASKNFWRFASALTTDYSWDIAPDAGHGRLWCAQDKIEVVELSFVSCL